MLLIIQFEFRIQHLRDCEFSLDRTGDMIDILGLDEGFEVIFEYFGEVVLKL